MSDTFQAIKVSDHVYWVGAIDWGIRDFHGYSTNRGTTYNAYLVMADRITLIDTVKQPFQREFLARLRSVVDLDRIRYIVSNHAEMDHSGALPETISLIKPEKVFASSMGAKALHDHFGAGMELEIVPDGGRIDLGNRSLTFLETRMLHWPDSMVTYMDEDRLLFSQDAFGMHLATSARFADEVADSVLEYEAAKYYANILLPYSHLVSKLGGRLHESGLDIRIIAPDHGPVWRRDPGAIVERYLRWAEQKPTRKAVVAYDTMWGSTDLMARAIGDGLAAGGATPVLMPLKSSHRSDIATEILQAGALVVGSPTLNGNLYPTVADLLVYLRGLRPKNLIGAAFGSYGWGCKAVPQILEFLTEMGVAVHGGDGIKTVYVPRDDDLSRCVALGREIGENLKGSGPV